MIDRFVRPAIALAFALAAALPRAALAEVSVGDTPEFEGTTLDGRTVRSSDLRGSVVLVDFWASWCAPCAASFPFYRELAERYSERGLVIVAIGVDEIRRDAERFLEDHPAPFVVLWDSTRELVSEFSPSTMPTAYLLDANGTVTLVHEGFRTRDAATLEEHVIRQLAAQRPTQEPGRLPEPNAE